MMRKRSFATRKAARVRRGGRKRVTWEERKVAIRRVARAGYERRLVVGDLTEKDFVWCVHCERVWYRCNQYTWCPGEGCDGGGPFDLWEWARVREVHEEYPEVAVPGKVYRWDG